MNMPLVLLNRRRRGNVFTPSGLFALAEPGVWYDPSDLTTLFTDTAGTTPVTTPGQTVALALDKSKGLTLGPELVTNGDFSSGTGWTAGTGWTISGGVASANIAAGVNLDQSLTTTINKTYQVTYTITSFTSGSIRARLTGTANISGTVRGAVGTYTELFHATATNSIFRMTDGGGGFVGSIDNISVKELPGFHATQATAASRPTYGIVPRTGRRNLLTRTEEFDNAAWAKSGATVAANAAIAPDSTTTADLLYPSSSGNNRWVYQTYSGASAIYTRTVYAKASGKDFLCIDADGGGTNGVYFNLSTGAVGTVSAGYTASITSAGNGWYRCSVRNNSSATTSFGGVYAVVDADNSRAVTASGTNGILLWGAQLELGSTATAYQRVGSAFDVTEAGVASLSYLSFDGVDDFLVTPTITPGTDKAQIFAGVRKLSDAARAIIAELSTTAGNAGTFVLEAPSTASGNDYRFGSGGSLPFSSTARATGYTSPLTNVVVGFGDISADSTIIRVNGTQQSSDIPDQGTGNFLAYPLYIGRRGGTTLPFNGNLYGLIVRFGANLDAGTITSTETWVNGKTGAYA